MTPATNPSWASALQTAVTVLTGLVILGGAYRASSALLRRTVLSRRDLARRLNRLACGTTAQYTDSIFGPPAFRRALEGSYEEHLYHTRHAWLQTIVNTADQSITAFAITGTDPRFKFSIRDLTNFQIDARLGHTRFGDITHQPDGIRAYRGARLFMHAESHWFGNPGNYQVYVLAYNHAGTGHYTEPPDPAAGRWATWAMGRLRQQPEATPSEDPIPTWLTHPRAQTTINTLLIYADTWHGTAPRRWWRRQRPQHQPKALSQHWIGVDADRVRLLHTPQQRRETRRRIREITRQIKAAERHHPLGHPT